MTDIIKKDVDLSPEEIQEVMRRKGEAIRKIRDETIRYIKDLDWTSIGGRPYPDADKLAKFILNLEISYKILDGPKVIGSFEEDGNKVYICQCKCRAWIGSEKSPHILVEEVGHSTSSDKFFEHQEFGERIKNVFQKCSTDAFGRAMRTLLGLRGLTWDELKKFGIHPKIEVKFKKKKKEKENNQRLEELENEIESLMEKLNPSLEQKKKWCRELKIPFEGKNYKLTTEQLEGLKNRLKELEALQEQDEVPF